MKGSLEKSKKKKKKDRQKHLQPPPKKKNNPDELCARSEMNQSLEWFNGAGYPRAFLGFVFPELTLITLHLFKETKTSLLR